MKFYKKDTTVECSQFNELGYFIRNTKEFVSKGTALGPEFTTNIYTPKEGYIGKYDKETDKWVDVKSNLGQVFYAPNGEQFIIDTIDGQYPEWAVKEAPPNFDPKTQTVLHKDDNWKVYDIKLDEKYYDEDGHELTISDINFDLPENHSFTPPPTHDKEKGQTVTLIDGKWVVYTQCTVYLKTDCNQSATLVDKSLITDDYTLTKPATQFDEWIDNVWVTNLSNKYIYEYNQVDDKRRQEYSQSSDPLVIDAMLEEQEGNLDKAKMLKTQALCIKVKVKAENPWPVNPT